MIRVLIADDHQVVREGLRAILEASGDLDLIGEAANGEEAVHLAGQLDPDVVLMDLRMPELDGIEAIRRIKARQPEIEIVILTTYDDDELIVRKRLKPALEKDGYNVEVYDDGSGVLKRLKEKSFDIVVTDVRMDDVDGIQVLEEVLARSGRTKVIIITGYASEVDLGAARQAGVDKILAQDPYKPPTRRPKRSSRPLVHAKDPGIRKELRAEKRMFEARFDEASEAYRGGNLEALGWWRYPASARSEERFSRNAETGV